MIWLLTRYFERFNLILSFLFNWATAQGLCELQYLVVTKGWLDATLI